MKKESSNLIIFDPTELLDNSSNVLVPEGTNPIFKFKSNKIVKWELDDYGDYEHFIIDSQTGEIKFSKPPDFENPLNTEGTIISVKLNLNDESKFFIELFDYENSDIQNTPITAENFLKYVADDSYKNSFFHRAINGFVLQGGGFYLYEDEEKNLYYSEIESKNTIQNEPGNSNTKGTVAMAKVGGDPDSATSQWFINLEDNSNNLDNQNGGFTVFGRIIGDGMEVIENLKINGLNDFEYINLGYYLLEPYPHYPNSSVFANLPLWERVNIGEVSINDFVFIEDIDVLEEGTIIESYKYKLKVNATDENGETTEHLLNISVRDEDEISPLIISPSLNPEDTTSTISIEEENSAVYTYTADENVSWSLNGGSDQDKFAIDESTGALSFVSAPDFENPTDSDSNNTYTVSVKATDEAGNSSSQTLIVTITDDEDQDPGIIFTVAGDHVREDSENSSYYFEENNVVVGTVSADEEYTWEIIGTDSDLFTISSEGVVSFISAPDYENPTDSDQDNAYVVELKATDVEGNEFLSGEGSIFVTDVEEAPAVKEPYQSIYTENKEINYTPGQDVSFDISYTTSDETSALSGLGLRVHYDSSVLTPLKTNNGVAAYVTTFSEPVTNDDSQNFDNDLNTDKYISISWLDFQAKFPGGELPAKLAQLTFATSSDAIDSITGDSISTSVNYTAGTTAENYDFLGSTTTLKPATFNLDVDGNGNVSALGDGLMIIRKLFGAAFAGEALTSKAISNEATRTTEEVHEFIQNGIDSKALDVDGNGQVSALGDGLMIIRKLFGAAFAGEALTSKAISNEATRTTAEIHDYIDGITDV